MQNINTPKVGILDVLRAFWKGVKPQKWSFWFVVFTFFLSSILYLVVPLFYKQFFDLLTNTSDKLGSVPKLVHLILIVLTLHGVIWVLNQIAFVLLNNVTAKTMARLRQMSFDYTLKHSYSFFTNNFTGSLVQKVGRFSRSFERLYDTLCFNLMPLVVNVVVIIVVIYIQAPTVGYIIMGWTVVMLAFNYAFSIWKLKYDIQVAKADTTTTGLLSDALTNQNTMLNSPPN